MGKGGKGKAAPANLTEDELLEQAIAANKAAADAAEAGIRPLTQQELLKKLDQVLVLNIVATTGDGKNQIVPGVEKEIQWFSDVLDAKAALTAMQAAMPPTPGFGLGLDFTPLGRAYSLSEGWVKAGSGDTPPMQLKPSSQVLAVCGEAGVKELDKQMSKLKNRKGVNKRQGAFPLFYLDELQSKDVMPIFFTRDDLVTCWMSSGRAFEDMPSQLSVIDLRVLVARALTEPNAWLRRLTFVPPQCLVDLMGMVDGISDKLEEVSKLAAKTTGEAIAEEKRAKEEKVASGEEPPELV